MPESCKKCGAVVALTQRECPVCNTVAGFPNVRAADRVKEVDALTARYNDALASARARNVLPELSAFEAAVARSSKAVMNRSLGALSTWLNGDSPMFYSFHYQVRYQGRVPAETEWDEQRGAAEAAINPFYYQELNYAALTLDGLGMAYYGPYAVTLKSITIDDRASVFEQNPIYFCKIHHVVAGKSPALGYRATWADRGRLAAAKLQPSVAPGCDVHSFPHILMESRRDASDCDFVEVHIFGPINRLGIERIVGPQPAQRVDRATWKQAMRMAKNYGAVVEVIE
jgi:hypothetical protein